MACWFWSFGFEGVATNRLASYSRFRPITAAYPIPAHIANAKSALIFIVTPKSRSRRDEFRFLFLRSKSIGFALKDWVALFQSNLGSCKCNTNSFTAARLVNRCVTFVQREDFSRKRPFIAPVVLGTYKPSFRIFAQGVCEVGWIASLLKPLRSVSIQAPTSV